jgi:hypothetical protein
LLVHGRWFSPGIPASSTTKTDRHDIAEILLKVALKHQKSTTKIKPLISTKQTITSHHNSLVSNVAYFRCILPLVEMI